MMMAKADIESSAVSIKFLKENPENIAKLADIWYETLGKKWIADVSVEQVKQLLKTHNNTDKLPLTLVAYINQQPVGMCSLVQNDGICPEMEPWLASLVVEPKYQNLGVGKRLIKATVDIAKKLHFEKLYLFVLEPSLPSYYHHLGWRAIAIEDYKGYPVTVMELVL